MVKLQDMIYVVESKPAKRYGDFFLRQIAKVYKLKLRLVHMHNKSPDCYFDFFPLRSLKVW